MNRSQRNEIVSFVQSLITKGGCECVEVEWAANEKTLRVYVDSAAGVTIDQCAEITRELRDNHELDRLVPGEFDLEISSPGFDRPLRTFEHFKQSVGQKARIDLVEAVEDRKSGTGIIESVSAEGVVVLTTSRGSWRFQIGQVDCAFIVYQWPEPHRPKSVH